MDLFKLVGSISVNNSDANQKIDDTSSKAKSMATKVSSAFESAGGKISKLGKTLAPVSAVFAGAVGLSVRSASSFTDGMAKMSTLFDTTKYSVGDLSNQFLDLSNKTGLSATELAEAGYQALSAGQDVEQVAGFVETAGNLAKAGFTSTATAVDVLTTAMNAYGENAGTAEEISNKLVRTQNLGKTTVDELASSMGRIIPTASSMGVNIDNLTSGYVSLTKQGISTAESTTYMNSMLNELGKSSTDVGKLLKKKTGKSFQDLMADGNSLADVLQILQTECEKSGTNFNELWGSAEAGKAGLAILNGGVEEFNATVDTMASKTDDVGDALDKLNTPSMKVRKVLNQIKNSAVKLGSSLINALAPALEKVAGWVESLTNWFNNLPEGVQTGIASFMLFVAVLSPLIVIVGKVIGGISSLIKVFSVIKTAIVGAKTAFGALSAVMSANPIGLVIVAITALVGVFAYLWENCEGFREFWINLWNTISTKVTEVWNSIKSWLSSTWESIKTKASEVWESIKTTISEKWETLKTKASNTWDTIKSSASTTWDSIKTSASEKWDSIKTTLSNTWDSLKETASTTWDTVSTTASTTWESMKTTASDTWETMKTNASDKWSEIQTTVSPYWETMKTTAEAQWEGIKTSASTMYDAIKNQDWETVKTTLSTSWESMKSTASTAFGGILTIATEKFDSVKTTAGEKITALKESLSGSWGAIKTNTSTTVSSIWSTVTGRFDAIKTSISTKLTSAKNSVKTIFDNIKTSISEKLESAKTTVQNAIDAIKGFFDIEIKFPHIPLPHFSIKPKGWKIADLLEGSIPSLGVEFYAKGGILKSPTIFGMNGGKPMVGGEAGEEAVAPIDELKGYVSEAVAEQNAELVSVLKDILHVVTGIDDDMYESMKDAVSGLKLQVNEREFGRMVRGVKA